MSDAVQERISAYWSSHAPAYDASQTERMQQHPGAREVWAGVWSQALRCWRGPLAPGGVAHQRTAPEGRMMV